LFVVCVKKTCQFVDNSENSEGMTAFTSSELQRNGLQVSNTHLMTYVS